MQPNDPNQPMPGSAPMDPQQPIDPQQPMGPQPMQQPINQPMGQPMPNQPMGQPMPGAPMYQPMPSQQPMGPMPMAAPKPPKQPMDPAKKKTIIILCSVFGGLAVVGIALAIILPIVLRVDYSEAYKKAKELRTEVNEIYSSYACTNVESYVDSKYTSNKTYEEYVDSCRSTGQGADKLVSELGATAGVQRNGDISAQYDAFKKIYDTVSVSDDTKTAALDAYTLWHKWVVAAGDLSSWDETDADLTAAANILINSGNDQFKTYGEGWLEHRKAAAAAYRAYWAASYSDSNKSSLRTAMNDAQNSYNTYVSENKPSTSEFPSVTVSEASRLKTEFDKLYDLISDTYEKNYTKDSGDCWEIVGEVICD